VEGRRVGRYVIGQELAAGGMATVHLGRMQGPAGFGKTVAIKRLHAQFAKDIDFAKMFLDEARVTSGLMHPNIVMTLDVLDETDGLYLVMEYVHGISLAMLQREVDHEQSFPLRIVSAIVSNFLEGLHAAHEATDDLGAPLGVVHRDVSPQNVMVSFAGLAKIADFGIAKAAGRMHSTGDGSAKGKLSYMAPEQVNTQPVTPRTDVYAAGIVLWECLTRQKLVGGTSAAERLRALLELQVAPPSSITPGLPPALDALVMKALEKDPANRFATAKAMATELQKVVPPATSIEVADWLRETVPQLVKERDAALAKLQRMLAPANAALRESGSYQPISSSQPFPAVGSSPRLPSSSNGETSAGNHAINDYLTVSEKEALPARMPRKILAALIMLPVLALIGIVLVVVATSRSKSPTASAATKPLASNDVTAEPPSTTGGTATAAMPAPPPTSATEVDATPAAPSVTATSTSAPAKPAPAAAPATKPGAAVKPTTSNTAGKKCRIVATPDKSGRMKFEEVCTP
jgi:serine/threonine protein kinase